MFKNIFFTAVASFVLFWAMSGYAVETSSDKVRGALVKKQLEDERLVGTDQTRIDFSETLIQGKLKAPTGFFIQGKHAQTLKQMTKLRSAFSRDLMQSRFVVRSFAW